MAAVRFGRNNKYQAKRTDGFPSRLEASLYYYLCELEKEGKIKSIKRQQGVNLIGGIRWKVDFSYELVTSGELIYAEAKGIETADYKIKLKLWKNCPPAVLEIYKGRYTTRKGEKTVTPFLVERVEKKHEMPTLR